jgi:hypothetical protein
LKASSLPHQYGETGKQTDTVTMLNTFAFFLIAITTAEGAAITPSSPANHVARADTASTGNGGFINHCCM